MTRWIVASEIPSDSHDIAVDDQRPTGGGRPHRELLVTGNPELAHDKHIERQPEACRDLVTDGNAAAR